MEDIMTTKHPQTKRNMRQKKKRWEDYDVIEMPNVVTFGTTLFMRNDGRAIRIVFPTGTTITFAPEEAE